MAVTSRTLHDAVKKAHADVPRVSRCEPADVDRYLKTDLGDLSGRRKLMTQKSPPKKKRGALASSSHRSSFLLPFDIALLLYLPTGSNLSAFRDLCSGAAEPEEPDSEWAAAVSNATDSQGCMAGDEEAARVLQEIDKGNFAVMTELAAGLAAVDAVAAAQAEEKRAAPKVRRRRRNSRQQGGGCS